MPVLQASGYNSIAVGLTNGNSSIGPTVADGAGRSKPDLVAPLGVTSFATPVVSAGAALLVQTAAAKIDPAEALAAGRTETIKAALLSGATTSQFNGLAQPWHRMDNGGFVEPLDRRFGAGQINIDNSHQILSAPRQDGTDLTRDDPTGWDFGPLTTAEPTRRYFFDAPADVSTADPHCHDHVAASDPAVRRRLFDRDGDPGRHRVADLRDRRQLEPWATG